MFTQYDPRTVVVRYTNRSTNEVVVSYVTAHITWRAVPNADRSVDMVGPMNMDMTLDTIGGKDQRLRQGESGTATFNFPSEAHIATASGGLTATATAHWTFVNPRVDATCRLGPERTVRVGSKLETLPFNLSGVRVHPGVVLADTKLCGVGTGDRVMDVSGLWAVTVKGVRVNVSGSETPRAKAAGAGRLTVPVASTGCRTTTVAFLTSEKLAYIASPTDDGVPWRWKL